METMKDSTEIAMRLIAHSGDARSYAFAALELAKEKKYDEAKEKIKLAEECSVEAHKAQTDLLVQEANGERVDINVLLIHSQDHLMTSMLALELIRELVSVYEVKEDRKEE